MLEESVQVKDIEIPRMPNGQVKGYAVIHLEKPTDVKTAIEKLDQKQLDGKILKASNKLTNI